MTGIRRRALLSVSALCLAAPASAQVLTTQEILTEINAVVRNDFTSNSDVEGRLVAGNISGGATFYNNPAGNASVFQAVNALSVTHCASCNVDNGGSVAYVTSAAGTFNFTGGGALVQAKPAFAMSDLSAPLDALAKQLAALTPNGVVNASDPNNFTFSAGAGTAVFSLTAALLQSARNIEFNLAPSTGTVVIDVTGPAGYAFTQGGNFNANAFLNSHVIWNFIGASSLTLSGWHGAVLAGDATVSNSSALEGFLYAEDFVGQGELHDYAFEGALTSAAPEPATWALLLMGFAGLGWAKRRAARA